MKGCKAYLLLAAEMSKEPALPPTLLTPPRAREGKDKACDSVQLQTAGLQTNLSWGDDPHLMRN